MDEHDANPFAPEEQPTWPPLMLGGCEHRTSDLLVAFDVLRWLPVAAGLLLPLLVVLC